MKTLLIVYHSMTGGAAQMAAAVERGGATESGIDGPSVGGGDGRSADVLQADGYVFVTPENLASMSGIMKDFFDRTYYAALDRLNGRPYAALICAGSDGQNAARQIERICTGWRLKRVADTLIVSTRAQTPEEILAPKTIAPGDLAHCEAIGAALASGLALGVF
jgi:hypothetical protein